MMIVPEKVVFYVFLLLYTYNNFFTLIIFIYTLKNIQDH